MLLNLIAIPRSANKQSTLDADQVMVKTGRVEQTHDRSYEVEEGRDSLPGGMTGLHTLTSLRAVSGFGRRLRLHVCRGEKLAFLSQSSNIFQG
jgi:hypothetical protein